MDELEKMFDKHFDTFGPIEHASVIVDMLRELDLPLLDFQIQFNDLCKRVTELERSVKELS